VTVEQVVRELKLLGFSDIRKVVSWRNEMVAREDEEAGKGEDGVVRVTRVLLPRVSIVPSEEMDPDIAAAIHPPYGTRNEGCAGCSAFSRAAAVYPSIKSDDVAWCRRSPPCRRRACRRTSLN
jgi:hypothetical protein